MKKIVFFDLNIVGIARYPLSIANEVNNLHSNEQVFFYFLYEEDPASKLNDIIKILPENSQLIKIKKVEYNDLRRLFLEINPKCLLVMAQRIPDSALVSLANDLGIQTFKFQHGLYIPFMKRKLKMFFDKIKKTHRFLLYIIVLAKSINQPLLSLVKKYLNIFIRGVRITEYPLPFSKINANKVFVYGDAWKIYHKVEFGYSEMQQITVGYPDLTNLPEIKSKPKIIGIGYICQTLVEDGRMSREQMIEFIKTLAKSIGSYKLYVKLHPRSDMSLYQPLVGKKNVHFVNKTFPHCSKYIGHYSSLIAKAAYITNDILLWEFHNHNEYPHYIIKLAQCVTADSNQLKKFIDSNNRGYIKNNSLENYFYYNQENTYTTIAKELLN